MKITSIDIGHTNMAILQAEITYKTSTVDKTLTKILMVNTIDLKDTGETEMYKKMKKFIDNYTEIFNTSKYILIERQPIQGLTSIQEIIAYQFPDKVKLISPRSMHCYFGINHYPYETRKEKTIEIADKYLNEFSEYQNSRKHDLADAFCILKFFIGTVKPKEFDFDKYKYIPQYTLDKITQFSFI